MSAIKSLSSETLINPTTEPVGIPLKSIGSDNQQGKQGDFSLVHQQIVKKMANRLMQKIGPKLGGQFHSAQEVKLPVLLPSSKLLQLTPEVMLPPNLTHIKQDQLALDSQPNKPQSFDELSRVSYQPKETQQVESQDDEPLTVDYQPKILLNNELLDDEVPLINMSGSPILPHQAIPQYLSRVSNFSAKVGSEPTKQSVLTELAVLTELTEVVQPSPHELSPSGIRRENPTTSLVSMAAKLQSLTGSKPEVNLPAAQLNEGSISGQESLVMTSGSRLPENQDKVNIGTFTKQASERFMQDLTNIEKNQPDLQEIANIDEITMTRSMFAGIEAPAQTYVPAKLAHEPSLISQKVAELIEHHAVSPRLEANESAPRTLTYTFQNWKNAPSVTFELAAKTEFIATTYSREVQQALQENRHLLSHERNIYFRQDQGQEREQQHKQQQESYPQEEE